MMIQLDKQTMELVIRVGVLEKYVPNKDVKAIHKKAERLKLKMEKFMVQTVESGVSELESMIQDYNKQFIVEKES